MKRAILALLLTLAPLTAQSDVKPEPPKQQRIQKLFILKYAEPRSVQQLLNVFDAQCIGNSELHAMAVTATPETMKAVEEAINKLDVPSASAKNIDLTMQLVIGSDTEGAGTTLPKDLEPVVAQLRNAFPFKNYRLLDVLTLRSRVGLRAGTDSSGGAMVFNGITKPVSSSFNINSSSLGGDGSTVRLDGLRASSKIPVEQGQGQFSFQDLSLNTDVDIKEGQKVVIGRHGINREQALFLVLTTHIVQ
jgi:hypothetical protein